MRYYNGHPGAELAFDDNIINFTCLDVDDPFDSLSKSRFAIEQRALITAYESMLPTILSFKHNIGQALEKFDLPVTGLPDLSSVLTIRNVELSEEDPVGRPPVERNP